MSASFVVDTFALNMTNGGAVGAVTLSSSGNVVQCNVRAIQTKGSTFSPPGSGWTASRVTGRGVRRVEILWRIVADSLLDLRKVSAEIDSIIVHGQEGVLTLPSGRVSVGHYEGGALGGGALLLGDGTGPRGPRQTYPDGRTAQWFALQFVVVSPTVGTVAGYL